MPLLKSEKAKLELIAKIRTLDFRERVALLLADGVKTRKDIQNQLLDDGSMLDKLLSEGYLITSQLMGPDAAPNHISPATAKIAEIQTSPDVASVEPTRTQVDNFEGKRSLATTRMFLFDICERMFIRKAPSLATQFRDQLREAKDRESMMVIAREIILNIEKIAGTERADGLSERISRLLPPEQ
jgi:hypothetical protein